jgi:hypothetical protein
MIPNANTPYIRTSPRGCVWDLTDPGIRAEAVAIGLIWSAPYRAQQVAVLDIAAGRIERPATMPEWASNTLAYYAERGIVPDASIDL